MNSYSQVTSSAAAPTRRAVAKAVAWSVPAVAVTAPAPAVAASRPCAPVMMAWSAMGSSSVSSGQKATVGGTTVTYTDTGATGAPRNSTLTTGNVGGIPAGQGLALTCPNGTSTTAQTIAFSFSSPVTNVSLTIADIDWDNSAFQDRIVINTPGFSGVRGSQITGSGTAASPYQAVSSVSGGVPNTSSAGNVTVTWAGPLTQLSMTYDQGGIVSGSPFVAVSGLTFTPTVC